MLEHIGLHRRPCRAATFVLTAILLMAAGCSTTGPSVKVLGVQQARATPTQQITVFVEVVNPTSRELTLSRLEYRVRASSWFESEGAVALSRQIGAESSAVVEIQVPVKHMASAEEEDTIPYTLEGKLFAREDRMERSWNVAVTGALGARRGQDGSPTRVTVIGE
jgi:LEA14-like dessication related protein